MAATSIRGVFFGLDPGTLQTLLTQYTAALAAVAVAGQEYTISGRTFKRADLPEISTVIMELKAAIDRAAGARLTQAVSAFSGPYRK